MARQISNYGDLQLKIQAYLNKGNADVVFQIETFIALAERKIFRQLRCPSNEKIVVYPADGSGTITKLQLPDDYLESKLVFQGTPETGGPPLERISEQSYYNALGRRGRGLGIGDAKGAPNSFARVGNSLVLYPSPDDDGSAEAGRSYSLYYWADFSGTLETSSDDNPILRIAPDVYLYGSLLEASPYVRKPQDVQLYSEMFKGAMDLINGQVDEAEYSGSNVGVSNAVAGAYGDY
jgi:hypothetical protein